MYAHSWDPHEEWTQTCCFTNWYKELGSRNLQDLDEIRKVTQTRVSWKIEDQTKKPDSFTCHEQIMSWKGSRPLILQCPKWPSNQNWCVNNVFLDGTLQLFQSNISSMFIMKLYKQYKCYKGNLENLNKFNEVVREIVLVIQNFITKLPSCATVSTDG